MVMIGSILEMPLPFLKSGKENRYFIILEVEREGSENETDIFTVALNEEATKIIRQRCEKGDVVCIKARARTSIQIIDDNIVTETLFIAEALGILKIQE